MASMLSQIGQRGKGYHCLLLAMLLAGLSGSRAAALAPVREPAEDKQVKEVEPQTRSINGWLAKGWEDNQLKPAPRTTDYQFIRRVMLDLVGRSATVEEVRAFVKDPRPDKRLRLIDRLLQHEDYVRHWANVWTTWLLPNPSHPTHREQLRSWLQDQLARNVSHKEMTQLLLTATGKTNENGAVNYLLAHAGPANPAKQWAAEGQFRMESATGHATRLFLGIDLDCVRCHDHAFNPNLKQKDFWGMNGFFRQVERVGPEAKVVKPKMPLAVVELKDNPAFMKDGRVFFEKRNGMIVGIKPTFLDGTTLKPNEQQSRREILADLLVKHENFGKAFVNRLWGQCFGRGLQQNPSVDDFGEHNEEVHPELLDYLAEEFVKGGHDAKKLLRWICNSDAYQLQMSANDTNTGAEAEPYFSRMASKILSPTQRLEAMLLAIQAKDTLTAKQQQEVREAWLAAVSPQDKREITERCCCADLLPPVIPHFETMRFLLENEVVNAAIMNKKSGTVARLLAQKQPAAALEELYLIVLNRLPTLKEIQQLDKVVKEHLEKNANLAPLWEDLLWVLLNTSEFISNH